jgi:hypothetical protein
MSLAQSAIEHSGSLKEMFRGGGQVNYTYALASVDRALHALGAPVRPEQREQRREAEASEEEKGIERYVGFLPRTYLIGAEVKVAAHLNLRRGGHGVHQESHRAPHASLARNAVSRRDV